MTARLDRTAWLRAGLKELARGGIAAVRVETLATRLRVTKGSFYWHFRDRADMLAAMLESWQQRATADVIDRLEAVAATPEDRLRALLDLSLSLNGRLESAIRAWAASDRTAARALDQVYRQRTDYVTGLFRGMGFEEPEASARASFAYRAVIGQWELNMLGHGQADAAAETRIIFSVLTARPSPGGPDRD